MSEVREQKLRMPHQHIVQRSVLDDLCHICDYVRPRRLDECTQTNLSYDAERLFVFDLGGSRHIGRRPPDT